MTAIDFCVLKPRSGRTADKDRHRHTGSGFCRHLQLRPLFFTVIAPVYIDRAQKASIVATEQTKLSLSSHVDFAPKVFSLSLSAFLPVLCLLLLPFLFLLLFFIVRALTGTAIAGEARVLIWVPLRLVTAVGQRFVLARLLLLPSRKWSIKIIVKRGNVYKALTSV